MINISTGFKVDRVRKLTLSGESIAVVFLGDAVAFVQSEESAVLFGVDDRPSLFKLHAGAILSFSANTTGLLTGGDDSRVRFLSANGEPSEISADPPRRWIDCVSIGASGQFAWSAGRQAFFRQSNGETQSVSVSSTVCGLAFKGDSDVLAVAHHGGVTLWQATEQKILDFVAWKGMLEDVTFSPKGTFLIARMREAALHGWRLQDGKEVPMHGYASRVQSIDWTSGGKWLATSGSQYLVLWPFEQTENPLSGVPVLQAGYKCSSTAVACHPDQDVVAVGYTDGLVLLIRIEDEAEILIKNPHGAPVTSIAWNSSGASLAIACKDGVGRIIDFVNEPSSVLNSGIPLSSAAPIQNEMTSLKTASAQ